MPINRNNLQFFLIGLFLLLLLVFAVYNSQLYFNKYSKYSQDDSLRQPFPLLLNSGLVYCNQAMGQYIIWTEKAGELPTIEKIIRSTGLNWNKQTLTDFSGKNAYKYTAIFQMKKENEGQYVELFRRLNSSFNQRSVKVYFEQRINAFLEPALYFQHYGIDLLSSVQTDNILSLTGYCQGLGETVNAGGFESNVQMVTRGIEGREGKTVLAFPALIEEF